MPIDPNKVQWDDATVEPGNIDLKNRPRVRNADGSISTVRSLGVNVNGQEVLIPTVSDDGRIMADQEAFDTYRKTGRHLGKFATPYAATAYARRLSEQQAATLGPDPKAVQWDEPTPRQRLLSSAPMRLAKGLKDPIDGSAQLLRNVIDKPLAPLRAAARVFGIDARPLSEVVDRAANAVGGPGTFLGDVVGIKGASPEDLRQDISSSDAEYEAARKATGSTGVDAMRLAGNVLSPVNAPISRMVPAAAVNAPVRTIAAKGAVAGAAGAAAQPVAGQDYWGEKGTQAAAGAAGGAVLAPVVGKIAESAGKVWQRYRSLGTVNVTPEGLRARLMQQLADDGIEADQIPDHVFKRLADDVRSALAQGKQLNPAALLRQQDFQALGLPATQGQLTRNPAQWQREFNLAGVEGVGEPLQAVQTRQSQGIGNRFQQGARGAQDRFAAGQTLIDQLRGADSVAQGNVRAAYDAFRQATGRDLDVPLQGLAQDYAQTLRDYGTTIPGAVRGQFEELGLLTGKQLKGLSIDDAERLLKVINKHYGSPDKAVRSGLDELRRGVQKAITDAADGSGAGAEAAHLASEARGMAAQRFRAIEGTPALRAAIDGMEPDQFVQRFVINGKVNELNRMTELLGPEGRDQARAQMVAYLQQKAFGANAAGDGKAAQAAFNNELQRIGRPKLVALLGEEGADEMMRIGRVLAYIKQVPEGATPNTSGTGQMLTGMLGKTRGLRGLPFVNDWLVQPVSRWGDRREVAQALSGVPQQAAELDPELVKALTTLFSPAPVAAGAALGYSSR